MRYFQSHKTLLWIWIMLCLALILFVFVYGRPLAFSSVSFCCLPRRHRPCLLATLVSRCFVSCPPFEMWRWMLLIGVVLLSPPRQVVSLFFCWMFARWGVDGWGLFGSIWLPCGCVFFSFYVWWFLGWFLLLLVQALYLLEVGGRA